MTQPKRSVYIFFITIIVMAFSCCERDREAMNHLDVAENIINSRPDVALTILDSIYPESLNCRRAKARYALLFSMALDKNYVDTTSFDVLQPAIDYYIKNGTPDEKLRTYYYQGRIYQNRQENDSALQCFAYGKEYRQDITDTLTMANLLVAQATIFFTIYKIDDFIKDNLDAASLFNKIGRFDSELFCLTNVLDGSFVKEDKHLADSILKIVQNRSQQYPKLQEDIIPYMLTYNVKFGTKSDVINVINNYYSSDDIDDERKIDLASAYYNIGEVDNALQIINSLPKVSDYRHSLKYLSITAQILEGKGDYANALKAYTNFYTALDSIHQNIFSHDLLFVEKRHEIEKANLLEIQKKNKIIWLSIGIILVCLIVTVLIYYRYRLGKTQRLLAIQENEKLKLESDANALKAENLEYQLQQLKEESVSLKNILNARQDLDQPVQNAIQIRLDMLNKLLATSIADNANYSKQYEEWRYQLLEHKEEFMNSTRLAYKATHPMFIDYLEKHGLSNDEINHACLYAIGLRGKDVGSYTKHSRYYHISSDIRKKLGIDEHQTNLGIYIRKLLKQL